jgi:hypothetical protein
MNIDTYKAQRYRLPDTEDGREGASDPTAGDTDERFEALLLRAMKIDAPDLRKRVPSPPRRKFTSKWVLGTLAASVILGVGLMVNMLRDTAFFSTGDIAKDVVVHIHHEPGAFESKTAVPRDEFEGVLKAAGATMTEVGTVSYVKLCPFRGTMVAHFVVQGSAGPVTVLLLPDEEVTEPVPVDEDGIVGTIVSLETGGSIAVVGNPGEQIEDIQNRVAAAVKWRL